MKKDGVSVSTIKSHHQQLSFGEATFKLSSAFNVNMILLSDLNYYLFKLHQQKTRELEREQRRMKGRKNQVQHFLQQQTLPVLAQINRKTASAMISNVENREIQIKVRKVRSTL